MTKERVGRRLLQQPVARSLFLSLKTHVREPIAMKLETVKPRVTRASAGYVVVIHRGENRLRLYDGMRLHRTFGVATGETRYPTPIGKFRTSSSSGGTRGGTAGVRLGEGRGADSARAGQSLGTRWMGLSVPAVGIHGTPDPASIGYSVSHGCIGCGSPRRSGSSARSRSTPVYIVR